MADLMERVDTTAEPVHAALTLQFDDDHVDHVDGHDDDDSGSGGDDVLNEANMYNHRT